MKKIYSKIESVIGNVITVRAEDIRYGDLAKIETGFGTSLAEVIRLTGDMVSLQVFAGGRGISTGDTIEFLGHPMEISFSENLLGRVFTGSATPRDNGPSLAENLIPIGGPSVNPSQRIIPQRMIRTGIPMIDLFNTLVVSQKLPIFSISGEPYNQLLARIAMQAEVDVIVLGGMGLKYDDYLFFRDTLEQGGALCANNTSAARCASSCGRSCGQLGMVRDPAARKPGTKSRERKDPWASIQRRRDSGLPEQLCVAS